MLSLGSTIPLPDVYAAQPALDRYPTCSCPGISPLYFCCISVLFYFRSPTTFDMSSPFVFADPSSDDSGLFGVPISPSPNLSKRSLPEEDNTASKRFRLSDNPAASSLSSKLPRPTGPSSSSSLEPQHPQTVVWPRPATSSSLSSMATKHIVQPQVTVGIPARMDAATLEQGNARFIAEVRDPMIQCFSHLLGKCTSCFILGDEDWEDHHHDRCQGKQLHYGHDELFVQFRKNFNYQPGFCFGCGRNKVGILSICDFFAI